MTKKKSDEDTKPNPLPPPPVACPVCGNLVPGEACEVDGWTKVEPGPQ